MRVVSDPGHIVVSGSPRVSVPRVSPGPANTVSPGNTPMSWKISGEIPGEVPYVLVTERLVRTAWYSGLDRRMCHKDPIPGDPEPYVSDEPSWAVRLDYRTPSREPLMFQLLRCGDLADARYHVASYRDCLVNDIACNLADMLNAGDAEQKVSSLAQMLQFAASLFWDNGDPYSKCLHEDDETERRRLGRVREAIVAGDARAMLHDIRLHISARVLDGIPPESIKYYEAARLETANGEVREVLEHLTDIAARMIPPDALRHRGTL